MHFDIVIKSPIVVFPRMVITDVPEKDSITAYLGEFYIKNKFVSLEDSITGNEIAAGIRNIRLASLMHYDNEKSEEDLEMIDKVDVNFKITYVEHRPGMLRAGY